MNTFLIVWQWTKDFPEDGGKHQHFIIPQYNFLYFFSVSCA